jgi:hypothetical protein
MIVRTRHVYLAKDKDTYVPRSLKIFDTKPKEVPFAAVTVILPWCLHVQRAPNRGQDHNAQGDGTGDAHKTGSDFHLFAADIGGIR